MNNQINEQIEAIATAPNGVMSEGEIIDLLTAIELVQANGGQGSVKAILGPSGLDNIETHIGKNKPRAPISNPIAHWPRFIITPLTGDVPQ